MTEDAAARAERLNRVRALDAHDRESLLFWLIGFSPEGCDVWLNESAPNLTVRADVGGWISGSCT